MADDSGVPVWGIEAGDGTIRAVRLAPREDGGFLVLDYREEPSSGPGPEALVAFLKHRGLTRHAIAVAMLSPTSWFRSVRLSPDDLARPRDDMAACLAEYIPPEPENIDFKWTVTGDNLYLVSAEERARVESYMIALETAQVPAYGLVTGCQALHAGIARSGLLAGDGVVIRVLESWTDVLLLDDGQAARQALPLGRRDLGDDGNRNLFADDVVRIIDYHRSRIDREEPERIVLLGLDEASARAIGERLPGATIPFPEDATSVRGGGRFSLPKALEACRAAPAAVGAALSAVAVPRNEELSLRPLPTALPKPPSRGRRWLVASLLLWAAIGVAWFGLSAERDRLRDIVDQPVPTKPALLPEDAGLLTDLFRLAALRLAFPEAAATALRAVPEGEGAPFRADLLRISATPERAYDVDLSILLLNAGNDPKDPRIEAVAEVFRRETGTSPIRAGAEGNFRVSGTFRTGGGK